MNSWMNTWLTVPVMMLGMAGSVTTAAAQSGGRAAAAAPTLGGALPGGTVISAVLVSAAPAPGGVRHEFPIDDAGAFTARGLKPGTYRLTLSATSPSSVPKQTQGATFGEKVNAGLHAAGSAIQQGASAKAGHDTPKNSVGNVRGRVDQNSMPNRISMNVTIAKRTQLLEVDGAPMEVVVGADGTLTGVVQGVGKK